MVDVPLFGVGADHDACHAQPVAESVHLGGVDLVVETAPIVMGAEYRGAVPVGPGHHGIDGARHPSLPRGDAVVWVLAQLFIGPDPRTRPDIAAAGTRE